MKTLVACFVLICCISCQSRNNTNENGTPVSGAFTIYTDETYFPLISILSETYMATYPQVVIKVDTSATANAYAKLSDGTIRTLITSSPPLHADSIALSGRNIFPKIYHFATDAVVIITNSGSAVDSAFAFNSDGKNCLQDMFMKPLSGIITDRPGSENNSYVKSLGFASDSCMGKWFAAGNQQKVLDRISEITGEAGVLGWSYLCEKRDPSVKQLRTLVKIIPYRNASSELVFPTQSALITGAYPLSRKLFLVTAEPYAGPATGFAAFVASDEGQRIVRLFGLAPAKTPPRELFVN